MDDLISRVGILSTRQREAYELATEQWSRDGMMERCPAIYKRGTGSKVRYIGKQCLAKAGHGTDHPGYGECVAHGGARGTGRIKGYWLMAYSFAEEYDVSPWEALLLVVRITAGRVRYCEQVLAQATSDAEIEGKVSEGEPTGVNSDGTLTQGRNLSWWVETSERERMMLAKVSKAAIDAGVAQIMVQREIESGEKIAAIMINTLTQLDDAGVPEEHINVIRSIMGKELRRLDGGGEPTKEIEGVVLNGDSG